MRIAIITAMLLVLPCVAFAQDFCKGDFDFNGAVDADDVSTFLESFGRSPFFNPCPIDGPSPVPKTGQTTSYATGDDGDHERGVALVTPRFSDNGDGTVNDNQTGLIWLKNANCFGQRTWYNALSDCNSLASGSCGLMDGSNAGDWRLPNKRELISITDDGCYDPAVPNTTGTGCWSPGNPFNNVQTGYYWSSTTVADSSSFAWYVRMNFGVVVYGNKYDLSYLWCVRGGH